MKRKTKIIATMGPACASFEGVRQLVAAGIDVARLNFSHGEHETHRQFAEWVREAALSEGRVVAVLQDIQGPKIRTGRFPDGSIELNLGDELFLRAGGSEAPPGWLHINYPFLVEDIKPGENILLADGLIRMRVVEPQENVSDALCAVVEQGGVLGDLKGVAFPDSDLRLPLLSDKDREDLAFGTGTRRRLGCCIVCS